MPYLVTGLDELESLGSRNEQSYGCLVPGSLGLCRRLSTDKWAYELTELRRHYNTYLERLFRGGGVMLI